MAAKDPVDSEDTDLKPDTVYHYFVRALDAKGRASVDSITIRSQPGGGGCRRCRGRPKEVRLTWTAPAEDVSGYHVERAVVDVFSEDQVVRLKKDTRPLPEPSVGAVRRLRSRRITRDPVRERTFADTAIDLTQPATVEAGPTFTHRFGKDQTDLGLGSRTGSRCTPTGSGRSTRWGRGGRGRTS